MNKKTLLSTLLTLGMALGMFVGGVGSAYAVTTLDATARFTAGVAGASELLDFGSGGSQIYDDWHLHIVTDDALYLDAPTMTYVSGDMTVQGNDFVFAGGGWGGGNQPKIDFNQGSSQIYDNKHLHIATDDYIYLDAERVTVGSARTAGEKEEIVLGSTGSSSIYDDWNLHIVTDDYLFLDVPGTTTVSGALTVTGAATFNGAVTLGDATGDDITITGYVASDVLPKTTNTYNLGSSTKAWAEVHSDTIALNGATAVSTSGITYSQSVSGAAWGYGLDNTATANTTGFSGVKNTITCSYTADGCDGTWNVLTASGAGSYVYGDYTNLITTSATATSTGVYVFDGATTGGTQYGLHVALDDTDATNWAVYVDNGNANAYFANDVYVGASAETIDDAGFVVNGDDLFVSGMAGIEGNAYVDGNLTVTGTVSGTVDATDTISNTFTLDSDSVAGPTDVDVLLYFEDDTDATSYYFGWDDGLTSFIISEDLVPLTADTYNLGGTANEWNTLYLGDDAGIVFGLDDNITAFYDETTDDAFELDGALVAIGDDPGGATATGDGDLIVQDALEVDGATDLDSTLAVAGAATFAGAVTLGDAAGDDITVTGYVASSLLTKTDNTYDLGSSGQQWKDLYVNGLAYIDGVGEDFVPGITNSYDLGSNTNQWRDFYVDRLAYIDGIGETLPPGTADAYDLGTTAYEWRVIYLGDSGTALQFGQEQDRTIGYDEASDDVLEILGGAVSVGEWASNGTVVAATAGDLLVANALEVNAATALDSTLAVAGIATFNSDVDLVLATTETMTITHTTVTTADTLAIDITTSGAGTANGVVITANAAGTDPVDVALDIKANDTDDAMGIGARIVAAASATIDTALQILAGANGAVTTAIDVSDAEVGTALTFGDNLITGTYFNVAAGGLVDMTPLAGAADLLDITRSDTATAGDAVDIDMGAAVVAGDAIDILYGAGAGTGDAIIVDMGSNVAGAVLYAAVAGARSDAVIEIADSGTGSEPVIDVNMSGIHTGNVLDVTFASAAATDNAVDLNMGTNVAGQAIDIASAGTGEANTGAGINIAHTGVLADTDASVVRVTSNGAHAAAASLVELKSTGALAVAAPDGAVLKVTETGALQATTYAVYIASTSNEALHVDTGLSKFDEAIYADGGVDRSTAAALVLGGTANAITLSDATTVNDALTVGSDGTGHAVTFYSDTAGDKMVWDDTAASIELTITGTNAVDALVVADGNVNFTNADDVTFPAGTVAAADIADVVRVIQLPLLDWHTDGATPATLTGATTPNLSAEGNFDTIEWATGETSEKITQTIAVPEDYISGLTFHIVEAHDAAAANNDDTVGLDWYNAKSGEADNPAANDESATAFVEAETLTEVPIAMDATAPEVNDVVRLVFGWDALDQTAHIVATWIQYTAGM